MDKSDRDQIDASDIRSLPLIDQQVVLKEPYSAEDFEQYRKVLVSPTVNTPEFFQGYGGHNGWVDILRLRNNDLYMTFTAGYHHASPPTPLDICPEEIKALGGWDKALERYWYCLPFPDWDAPGGGQVMWIRSRDNGKTWTRPKPFPRVKRMKYPVVLAELSDGTLLCAARSQQGWGYDRHLPTTALEYVRMAANRFPNESIIFRSIDCGETWHEWSRVTTPCLMMDSPWGFFEAPDGSVMMMIAGTAIPFAEGWPRAESQGRAQWVTMILRSEDQGRVWEIISVVGLPGLMDCNEAAGCYLPDGSIGMLTRPTSAWFRSFDHGRTWSEPHRLQDGRGPGHEWSAVARDGTHNNNIYLYTRGSVVVLPDGVTAALFANLRAGQHGQVIYSRDNGSTWVVPAPDRGFQYNPWHYYPSACVLEDGSIFAVGHHEWYKREGCPVENPYGPATGVITATRFSINSPEQGEGIKLLPIGE